VWQGSSSSGHTNMGMPPHSAGADPCIAGAATRGALPCDPAAARTGELAGWIRAGESLYPLQQAPHPHNVSERIDGVRCSFTLASWMTHVLKGRILSIWPSLIRTRGWKIPDTPLVRIQKSIKRTTENHVLTGRILTVWHSLIRARGRKKGSSKVVTLGMFLVVF
jgi:hypothetical protein